MNSRTRLNRRRRIHRRRRMRFEHAAAQLDRLLTAAVVTLHGPAVLRRLERMIGG